MSSLIQTTSDKVDNQAAVLTVSTQSRRCYGRISWAPQ